jgi:hypothetical protein
MDTKTERGTKDVHWDDSSGETIRPEWYASAGPRKISG